MSLPPELRINIYRHYFAGLNSHRLRNHRCVIARFRPYLSLQHTNSQVRHEAAPIFYKEYMADSAVASGRSWISATRDCHTAMKRLKAIAQSLTEHNASVNVTVHFGSRVRIEINVYEPLQSSRFVALMLDHIYSQVPIPRTDHRSIVREYMQHRTDPIFVGPPHSQSPDHEDYDTRHVVGDFTIEYRCRWAHGFYGEAFSLDGPLAEVNWTMYSAPTAPSNLSG